MKNLKIKKYIKPILFTLILCAVFAVGSKTAYATGEIPIPDISVNFGNGADKSPVEYVNNIKLLILLTVLTLLPSILIMTTGFVRIVTVLSFFKSAVGAAQNIPKQIIIGLALFLTFFVMAPTFKEINDSAVKPYLAEEISLEEAMDTGVKPLRTFMLKQTRVNDLKLFLEVRGIDGAVKQETDAEGNQVYNYDDVPLYVIVPSFMISELRTAFEIGFLLFIPFILIDIVTSCVLMSMGMFMLQPAMISLPFKLLLFVLVDGWNLLSQSLIRGF